MLNRKIFISLTIIVNVLIITFVCVNTISTRGVLTIGNFIAGMILVNLMMILIGMLLVIISAIGTDKISNLLITPMHGYILFKMKRIYYANLGYFWTLKLKDTVFIFQQKPLYLKEVAEVEYDNLEKLKSDIESELKFTFRLELEEKERINEYKKWDGYLDKKSARDGKLKDIGIKNK